MPRTAEKLRAVRRAKRLLGLCAAGGCLAPSNVWQCHAHAEMQAERQAHYRARKRAGRKLGKAR